MANQNNRRWQQKHVPEHRLLSDNKRQLQCHPATKIRVKVIEPGVQARWCDRCKEYRYFILEFQPKFGALKFRWMSDREIEHHLATTVEVPVPEWIAPQVQPVQQSARSLETGHSLAGK